MQVRIEANNRVLNAKLVRFRKFTKENVLNVEGVLQFIQMHGRADYDEQNLPEILKCYAYENFSDAGNSKEILEKKYKFLEIMSTGTNATFSNPTSNSADSVKTGK